MVQLTEKQQRCKHTQRSKLDAAGAGWCLSCGATVRPYIQRHGLTRRQRIRLDYSLGVLRELNSLWAATWASAAKRAVEAELRAKLARVDRGEDIRQLTLFGVVLAALVSLSACGSSFERVLFTHDVFGGADSSDVVDAGRLSRDASPFDGMRPLGAGGTVPGAGGALATGGVATSGGAPSSSAGGRGVSGHASLDAGSRDADAWSPHPDAVVMTCVRYVGAVFVCTAAESTWYPCPLPPSGCHRAAGTDVVCCPN